MIAAATLIPWTLALLAMGSARARPAVSRLTVFAALPAALLALFQRGTHSELPSLLLGTHLAIDETAAVFLLCGAALWSAAAVYARGSMANDPMRHRFEIFFLWAMGAQLGLATSQDIASFYLLFFVMTIAAYGLVVHDGSARARHAGAVYLTMAILAEGVLLPGLILAASAAGTLEIAGVARALASAEHRNLIIGLLLAGFAVKVGLPPLHVWLPLAHPAAPTPASAVLSGLLIKAGLLGWLRFLPLGLVDLPGWGRLLLALALTAALLGALLGTLQRDAKSALAYSSVSQMGWMAAIVGLGLGDGGAWHVLAPVLLLFVAHHGLAKAALFLGVGLGRSGALSRWACTAGQALAALALAGAPGTTGAALKAAMKHELHNAPEPLADALPWLLTLASFGTAIVLLRVLALGHVRDDAPGHHAPPSSNGPVLAWLALLALLLLLPLVSLREGLGSTGSVVPIGLALLACGAWHWRGWRVPRLPPGDLLIPLYRLAPARVLGAKGTTETAGAAAPTPRPSWLATVSERAERRLAGPRAVTLLFLGLLAALISASLLRAAH